MVNITHRKIIGPYLVVVRDGKCMIQQGKPYSKGILEGLTQAEARQMAQFIDEVTPELS